MDSLIAQLPPQCSVEITQTTKSVTWNVKAYAATTEEAADMAEATHKRLKATYGGQQS